MFSLAARDVVSDPDRCVCLLAHSCLHILHPFVLDLSFITHMHTRPNRFTMTFASSSDEGLFDLEVLQARRDKEAASLAQWRSHEFRSKTFAQLHSWLFLTHQCYSVSRQGEFEKQTIQDPRLLASY